MLTWYVINAANGIGWLPGYDYTRHVVVALVVSNKTDILWRETTAKILGGGWSSSATRHKPTRTILPYDEANPDPYAGVSAPRLITR